jgi:hypothetical protein
MPHYEHICGLYYIVPGQRSYQSPARKYLPQVDLSVHSTIISSTSRTTLTQNFVNPLSDKAIPELRYTFPLYDGVSVVGFTCTVNKDRVIRGIVKERNEARKTYDEAVERGETAGLLEQLPEASDVFTTTVGNVPAGAEIKVEITYLGELKHDAEVDGLRFTIPTSIAPRYGDYPGELVKGSNVSTKEGIKIVIDADMPSGSNIKSVQSPSHPISVTIGNTSVGGASGTDMSLQKASATLSLGTAELDKDFVLQVVAADTGNPVAVLETHPTLPNHRAIMTTLVPKFNLPSSRPEIVFVCDRSGSMGGGQRIPHLKAALQIFLKSLPLGVKFNICSFGTHHSLLFDKGSVSYDASSLDKATKHVAEFSANFGGTEMYRPLEDVVNKRHKDMDLEIFLLTDGEVWNHENLFNLIDKSVDESEGAIRLFTLGIGNDVSHALIEGLARAGNGFAQTVMDNEKMNSKVLRMLKAALTPHIKDYTLEIKYAADPKVDDDDDGFEVIEKVMDALSIDVSVASSEPKGADAPKKTISLFDPTADPDVEMTDASKDTTAGGKYSGVPPISEPKLLQAPFVVPPLYPFNRTSVYLLLSPETTQKTPKSVVLRGTSAHGPLELEIPVTILPDKAETIHQLAARKAIRELEDGRGWIFYARDARSDGKLLREAYPGRFSDMVEREAVRLGVKFQVGGKWCSFVAVDDKDPSKEVGEQQVARFATEGELLDHSTGRSDTRAFVTSAGGRSGGRGGGRGGFLGGLFGRQAKMAAPQVYPASSMMPTGGDLRSAGVRSAGATMSMPGFFAMSAQAPPPPAAMRSMAPDGFVAKKKRSSGETEEELHEQFLEDDDSDDETCFRLMDDGPPVKPRKPRAQPDDVFEVLVALQTFEGYWEWTDKLLAALKIDSGAAARIGSNEGIAALGADLATRSNKLATAVVLAFLEIKMKDRKDEWEMMADKAFQWLEANVPKGVAGKYVDVVRDIVANLG